MSLGKSLFEARKAKVFSQEEVAEKLGVSRQTISKWELDETVPDIYQAKKLSSIYQLSLDELVQFDIDINTIEQQILNTDEKKMDKIDWTKTWGKKYPVLVTYPEVMKAEDIDFYASEIKKHLKKLSQDHHFSEEDTFLVYKDILAQCWKNRK